jgi:hypothetical protein
MAGPRVLLQLAESGGEGDTMDNNEIMDAIDDDVGYGLAAFSLQIAISSVLAERGVLSPADLVNITETAGTMVGTGVIAASDRTLLTAQNAIQAITETWRKPDKNN